MADGHDGPAKSPSTDTLVARIARGGEADETDSSAGWAPGTGVLRGLRGQRDRTGEGSSGNNAPPPVGAATVGGASDRAARDAEAARMTVFGARPDQVVSRPRYLGALLTLILLIFLAGVAAWASVFSSDDVAHLLRPDALSQPDEGGLETAAVPEEAAPADAPDAAAEGGDVELAAVDPDPVAPRQDALPAPRPRDPIRQRAPVAEPAPKPRSSAPDPEAEARYAATGVWVNAPDVPPVPRGEALDDLYVASIDPAVTNFDAVALPIPEADRRDRRPSDQATPAPPGTRFELDARGLVRATPDGAINPDGIKVFAGGPARLPPQRPEATLSVPRAETSAEIAAFRPRPRPGGLIESNERGRLNGYTRTELAAFRPRLRPSQSAEKRAAEAESERTGQGTAQAVAQSLRPETRPGGFERTVAAAQAAAIRPQAVVAPRQQTVQPSIPSNASVTRRATVRDAINLNKINLIGVYGQPASRRALVRMSDGRYRKVKVGDRIDGGRISAIGDDELRYRKGGRNHVLKMPSG